MKIQLLFKILGISVAVPVVAAAATFGFRNPIAKKVLESVATNIVGAKVEVDGLKVHPTSLGFTWDRLQVTNPTDTMTNVIETGFCSLKIEILPLLFKKIIIDDMSTHNLMFNTKRSTDGKIESTTKIEEPVKNEKEKEIGFIGKRLEKEKSMIPVFNSSFLDQEIDVNEIIEQLEFITPSKVLETKDEVEKRYIYWNDRIEDNKYEDNLISVKGDLNSINPSSIRSVDALQDNIKIVNLMMTKVDSINKDFQKDKTNFEQDIKTINTLKEEVPKWVEADHKRALELANLDSLDLEQISLTLFGDNLTSILLKVTDSIASARVANKTVSEKTPKKEKVKKDKYPNLPTLWIKNIHLNIVTSDNIELTGSSKDITTNQNKTGKVMTISLSAIGSNYGDLIIDSIFDYRGEENHEVIKITAKEIPLSGINLSKSSLLPQKIKSGDAKSTLGFDFNKSEIEANITFDTNDLEFDYSSIGSDNSKLSEMIKEITSGIDDININASLKTQGDEIKLLVDSNLDESFSREIKKLQGKEVQKAKLELQKRVDKELSVYTDDLNSYILNEEKKLTSKFDFLNDNIISQNINMKNKRVELEKSVENQIKAEADKRKKELAAEAERKKKALEAEAKKKAEEGVGNVLGGLGL